VVWWTSRITQQIFDDSGISYNRHQLDDEFCCNKCGFGKADGHVLDSDALNMADNETSPGPMQLDAQSGSGDPNHPFAGQKRPSTDLHNELPVSTAEFLEEEILFLAAHAWAGSSKLLQSRNHSGH
jgi:hypothetical protein